MRIIAGKFKGRVLSTVNDYSVRPATSRVKGSIFNILQNRVDWEHVSVLDLYAGSGSLGIEALSRGATSVTFVEHSREAIAVIKKNIAMLHAEQWCSVFSDDAISFVQKKRESYNVVFADPPYAIQELKELPSIIFAAHSVTADGYLIIEHPSNVVYTATDTWSPVVTRKYGRTLVTFFQLRNSGTAVKTAESPHQEGELSL
jgi:16S rRNA (guanine966-N2)-methyltransferase